MKTPNIIALHVLQAALAAGNLLVIRTKTKTYPKTEPCLQCGKPKTHNNCWCSVDCKKDYEEQLKMVKFAEKLAKELIN